MTIKDVIFLRSPVHVDHRGTFRKTFSVSQFADKVDFDLAEVFFSVSKPGVFRGMHLQTKKSASLRCITLTSGRVVDVLLDLRPDSASFLEISHFEWVSGDEVSSILIPPGVAHGFLALEEATLVYVSNNPHDSMTDTGVNPLTLDLPFLNRAFEISERDLSLPGISAWSKGELSI